jgi:hypothetical protein
MMVRSPKDSPLKSTAQSGPNGGPSVTDSEAAAVTGEAHGGAGYGQPPKRHQWKKGQSGNRAGRKKGSKNKRTIIIKLMEQKLGRKIEDISKLSRYEGLLLKGIQKALTGNTGAMAFILRRYDDAEAVQSRTEPISTEQDETVYAALVDKIKRELSETEQ